ncbi:hypothetical protein BH10ACI1_BH10ACI1_01980 [soil metagenome]
MIFSFIGSGSKFLQVCGKLFLTVAIIPMFGFVNTNNAQTILTRQQFSRLNVQTRAAYFENEILKAANEEGVDPNILWTIAYNETRFRPWLTSPKNARGMMQFIPATARRFDLENPYQPIPSIKAAARYVKYLSNLFGGRIDSILAAYNSGEGTVSAYLYGRAVRNGQKIINSKGLKTIGGVPPYSETIGYVGRGLKIYRWLIYRQIFPEQVARAKFPQVISSAVARIQVFDRELGKVPDFKIPAPIMPIKSINSENLAAVEAQTTPPDEESISQETKFTEVYYDSRSGNRYLMENGNRQKLSEQGNVVISRDTRPETTNSARSTFFAAPSNK